MQRQVVKFGYKFLLIFLPLLVLFSITEYKARRLPNTYARKKANFERIHDSVEVLILGSSHALKGIDPDYFSLRGFNFSNSSQTLFYDTRLCLKYLNEMPRLKIVIVELNYISFQFELSGSPEGWRDYFYYHYFGIRYPALDLFTPAGLTYSALYTKGLLKDLFLGIVNDRKEFGDVQANGWEKTHAPDDSLTISDKTGLERVRLHNAIISPANQVRTEQYLGEMIRKLIPRSVRVLFVSAPVYKTYAKFLNPSTERQNRAIIDRLCSKYGVAYYDFTRDTGYARGDFYDNDHLNAKGAEKFSRRLDKIIIASP